MCCRRNIGDGYWWVIFGLRIFVLSIHIIMYINILWTLRHNSIVKFYSFKIRCLNVSSNWMFDQWRQWCCRCCCCCSNQCRRCQCPPTSCVSDEVEILFHSSGSLFSEEQLLSVVEVPVKDRLRSFSVELGPSVPVNSPVKIKKKNYITPVLITRGELPEVCEILSTKLL